MRFPCGLCKLSSMRKAVLTEADVLCYGLDRKSQNTVRRFYLRWRQKHALPTRCDNPQCGLHKTPPFWLGRELPLILDHVDGCRIHNRPDNLRLLCPNCDAQLPTRGGKNKGRIRNASAHGFEINQGGGRQDTMVFPSGVSATADCGRFPRIRMTH
jgi:hypothetical protein